MECEWLILGDYAEVVGGKLYLQGGGWDSLTINTGLPAQHHVGIAAAFLVPWEETNTKQPIEIELLTADGQSAAKIQGVLEAGRPAGRPSGQAQRVQLAANLLLEVKALGTFEVVARVHGEDVKRIVFNVIAGPMIQMQRAS